MDKEEIQPITAVSLKGFKSLVEEQRIEIRPLTLLAGANSSGKSSAIQPLLLLKQTLESIFDPGPLLLHNSHVRFTSAEQLLSKTGGRKAGREFAVKIEVSEQESVRSTFQKRSDKAFDLIRTESESFGSYLVLEPGVRGEGPEGLKRLGVPSDFIETLKRVGLRYWEVVQHRCFLELNIIVGGLSQISLSAQRCSYVVAEALRAILHVPGLRGNPERAYPRAAVGEVFQGTFESYVASIVAAWQETKDSRLDDLLSHLELLNLTSEVQAQLVDAAHFALLVGRLPRKGRSQADLVNIADVGFGVSQVLPVLVALLTARPGQLVYLEQPELHLHPRAQEALAVVLADAANRGVQVVAETHSSLLLLAVQTLVVEGKLSSDKVKLHWFQRDARGASHVHSAELDELGAYGEWPEDFAETRLEADSRYLDAVEARAFGPKTRAKK